MGKTYNNQIKAGSGFTISGGYPIDDRAVVEKYEDLANLVNSNVTYEGMEVYVLEKHVSYKLLNTGWTELTLSGSHENQNAFSSIAVMNQDSSITAQTSVVADEETDTVTLVGGENVSITTDATNDKITIDINLTKEKVVKVLEDELVDFVKYLGSISALTELSTTAGQGDFYRVSTAFPFDSETAHVGDILLATKDNPGQSTTDWDLIHTESGTQIQIITWGAD